jgi:excisionase family DNA binding protein
MVASFQLSGGTVPLPNGAESQLRGEMGMTGELYTVAEAARILKVRESWLRTKATARLIPCTFVGKYLRFSDSDLAEIMQAGARQPVNARKRGARGGTT